MLRIVAGSTRDVVVDIDVDRPIAELTQAVLAHVGGTAVDDGLILERTGQLLDASATVGDCGVASGDVLVTVRRSRDTRFRPRGTAACLPDRGVSIDVLAGPDAGLFDVHRSGIVRIGRGRDVEIALTDPTVSRHHADVEIRPDGSIAVMPVAGVANPVMVNNEPTSELCVVSATDVVSLGSTRLAVRPFVRSTERRVDQLGQIEFQRTPYRPPVVGDRSAPELGPIPQRSDARRLHFLAALAPITAGVMMFAFTRQSQFLVLTLMSPLIMIATRVDDRRSGRKKYAREVAEFRTRLVTWRADIDRLRNEERIDRLRAAPDLADLARRARLRTVDLWARGRDAPDFLDVRIGLGRADCMVAMDIGRGGDDELRSEATAALAGADVIEDVPVISRIAEIGVLALHGPEDTVVGVASSLLMQIGCLHSPEDVTVAMAVDPSRPIARWVKWLPHLRSVASPLAGGHLVTDPHDGDELVTRLLDVAEFRLDGPDRQTDGRSWPWIVGVLDARLKPDPASVARLLDLCPDAGISVVWLADSAAEIPRQAVEVLVAGAEPGSRRATVWSTDPDVAAREVEVEQVRTDLADGVARALAPIRDASTASPANSIPRIAPLLDVLGVGAPTPDWVMRQWRAGDPDHLRFPIGMGASGPLVLDLVEDGPHALIGGTSGSGKSELMQSIVASLATHHPPNRLNFLFVDYKGGAASNAFGSLPHTVGYVTNLSAELSLRALTSLNAELNRRMRVMEGKAKDLAEMRRLHPQEAPVSLVIVVDEFATLVKEVPEFVAGVVDIAQRGRSLGIHLILATQRPSGSVNDNILANTNLRISLRMLDPAESTSVIGSPDAGNIPVPLKGRAYARLGPTSLAGFQSAYCGAPLTTADASTPVLVVDFDRTDASPKSGRAASATDERARTGPTQLEAVLAAIADASAAQAIAEPLKPWRDVLPEQLTVAEVLADERAAEAQRVPGRMVAVGMIDAPEKQDQFPAVVDLEEGGGWLVFGSGGSGKTTVLRTVAASTAACASADQVEIVGLDFASRGLAAITPLPNVVDVALGDDLEAVTRHIATLDDELRRRRTLLAAAHAEHLSAYNERHAPLPRILVLIDGYGGLMSTFAGPSSASGMASAVTMDGWVEMLNGVVVEGRQVGIHSVITADRRSAVPTRLHSAISNRLILRHADDTGYSDHGIASGRAKALSLAPGRGLWQADATVQIATISPDPVGTAQGATIEAFALHLDPASRRVLRARALPERLVWDDVAGHREPGGRVLCVPLGVTDLAGEVAVVDMTWSDFLVAGGCRSGRSSALLTCAVALRDPQTAGRRVWGAGPSSTLLDRDHVDELAVGKAADVAPLLERLADRLDAAAAGEQHVLLFDDLDSFDDVTLTPLWERLRRHDELRVIAAIETRSLSGYTTNSVLNELRTSRRMLLLHPDDSNQVLQALGVRSPARPGQRMMPGRGVLVTDRVASVVQVALAA